MANIFKLIIGFTDTSYWDDGNRGTSTTKEFSSFKDLCDFLALWAGKRYTFQGQEGEVVSCIDPTRLHILEMVEHDWKSIPCYKDKAENTLRKELKNIAIYGGDLKELEEQVKIFLGWDHQKFLEEWRLVCEGKNE